MTNKRLWKELTLKFIFMVSVFLAIFMLPICIGTYFQPKIVPNKVYEFLQLLILIMLFSAIFFVVAALAMSLFSKDNKELDGFKSTYFKMPFWLNICLAICFILIAINRIEGFSTVYPEGTTWVTKAFDKKTPLSETVAITYLWRNIREKSLAIFFGAIIFSFRARGVSNLNRGHKENTKSLES